MPRGEDLQELLYTYIDGWKTEVLEQSCWSMDRVGRITQLDDKQEGDLFRTDLQNGLGTAEDYNVQIQPNKQYGSRTPNSSRKRCIQLADKRSHALVLIHKDAKPRPDAVRDAFKSSCSQNNDRLRTKQSLHMRVRLLQDGSWLNEETGASKAGTEYEPKTEQRDPYDELPDQGCQWMRQRSEQWWNEFLAWRGEVITKRNRKTLTEDDLVKWTRRIKSYKEEAALEG